MSLATLAGLRHAGFPFDFFHTISRSSIHVTLAGFTPSLICFSGGGKYVITKTESVSCENPNKVNVKTINKTGLHFFPKTCV